MNKWKLHISSDENRITHYKCGLVAGDKIKLKKDIVVSTQDGIPSGVIHRAGEEWVVLTGITSDPVLWFRRPDGERCTWDDDAAEVEEWFERIP